MRTPPPSEVQEALQAFAEAMNPGWKVYDDRAPYAGRRFEYRSGARVLLSAQPLRYLNDPKRWLVADAIDRVTEWSAQVNVPFAAGPEVSSSGKFAQVAEWIGHQERVLSVPFKLAECKSREDAEAMASAVDSRDLVLLSLVFDIDHLGGRKQIVQELVKACAPVMRWLV